MKGVMSFILSLLICASVVGQSCSAGFFPILARKQNTEYADEESFRILNGNELVEETYYLIDEELDEFDWCIPVNQNYQYTLQMEDEYGDSWTTGSWLEIRGKYDNIFFKNMMTALRTEEYALSLYYPIEKNDQWKMTTGATGTIGTWTQYAFDDNSWTAVTLGSASAVSGTQYFRKTFTGVTGMAAYETRLNYRYGVVAYVNGAEVFRDNMPAGEVTASTLAPGGYENYAYHAFIRPGSEVASTQSVLAVELHFTDLNSHAVDFDAFMALLTPSTPGDSCFIVGEEVTLTSMATNPSNIFDFDRESKSIRVFTEGSVAEVSMAFPTTLPFVNGLRIWPAATAASNPTAFTWGGKNSEADYTSVLSVQHAQFATNQNYYAKSTFSGALYRNYKLTVTATGGSSLELYELQPLVCPVQLPSTIVFEPASYTYFTRFDTVTIRPTVTDFHDCTLQPALPAGLTFDTASCVVSGVATASLPSTVFTMTSSLGGQSFSGTFTLQVDVCSGTTVDLRRVYTQLATREYFTVRNSADAVVYAIEAESTQQGSSTTHTYLCLPDDEYWITLAGSNAYWSSGSYLWVDALFSDDEKEVLLRTRFDSKIGLTTASFSTRYPVRPAAQWKYKMGEVPAGWQTGDASAWSEAAMGSFPESSNTIQLYRNSFNVATVFEYAGVVLSLRYKFGCIVYLNGNEVFRNGVVGELTTASVAENIYPEVKYHVISLPASVLQQGANTIAIAVVSTASTKTSFFDCAVRLMAESEEYRVLGDWTVTSSGINGTPLLIFSDYVANSMTSSLCSSNHVTMKFGNDRRECVNAVIVQLSNIQYTQQPKQFTFKARNSDDEEWTTLRSVTGLEWSQTGQAKKVWIPNFAAYNQYRFENVATGNTAACTWKLGRLSLMTSAMNPNVPDLKYVEAGQTASIFKDIEMAEMYPNSDEYFDFSVAPALPDGITLDPNSGMISGTAHSLMPATTYTITAKKFSGESKTALLPLEVVACTGSQSLVTLVARTDNYPQESSYKLYEGKSTSGTVKAQNTRFPVGNSLNYVDWCLPNGIYTLQLLETSNDGWVNPAGWYLSVDVGAMKLDMGQVASGLSSVSTLFSSYFPFQVEYSDWAFAKTAVAADWTGVSFDASAWTVDKAAAIGTNDEITTYIRKEFSIPSLEDYAVLNVRVKYTGGVVVYVNGHKVARFNLAENYDANTQSIEAKAEPVFSVFHVILNTVQAATDKNVIAFEVHRPKDTSSELPVVFDATGVFGVNECSPVLDSYSSISEGYENYFDLSPVTYGTLDNAVGTTFEWTVENLEGSRFNAYAWQTASSNSGWGFSLYTRKENEEEFTSALALLSQAPSNRRRIQWEVPVGIAGYRHFKYTTDVATSSAITFSAHFLLYCRPASSVVCPTIDEYPPVAEGQISPASCPEGFRGYAYRECANGVLGDVKTDKCEYKVPKDLQYDVSTFLFVRDLPAATGKPTFKNLVTEFSILPDTLPAGLTFDTATGEISGTPTTTMPVKSFSVYAHNPKASTMAEITLEVRVGHCLAEGVFPTTNVGETAVYQCSISGSYVGSQKRACVLGAKDGEWQKTSGVCIPIVTIVIVVVVVIVVIVAIVFVLVKANKKKAPAGKKNGKKAPVKKGPAKKQGVHV